MSDAHGVARDQLRAFIERIERLEEEKKSISDDIKDVYGEAKGMGFIPAMMKKVIALRKKDELQRMEEEAILDTYLHALGMIQADLFEEPARQATPHDPETGEILEDINPRLAKQVVDGMQTEAGRAALIAAVDILIEQEEAEEQNTDAAISRPDLDRPEIENRSDEEAPEADASGGMQDEIAIHPATPIDPHEDREEGHSLDGNADANAGGGHVNAQSEAATERAGAFVNSAPARKPLRPLCKRPDNCGGYGSTHCASCLRASKQAEVAA